MLSGSEKVTVSVLERGVPISMLTELKTTRSVEEVAIVDMSNIECE